ncbi:winged helix-turn-helix domain-containing protein [Endothiovibrio diazotrophicus]
MTSSPSATNGLQLDRRQYQARFNGQPLELTPTEYRLLSTLAAESGRPQSRPHLLGLLYADHRVVGPRTLDAHVKNLRRKLRPLVGDRDPIRAVYGIGYQLDLG